MRRKDVYALTICKKKALNVAFMNHDRKKKKKKKNLQKL